MSHQSRQSSIFSCWSNSCWTIWTLLCWNVNQTINYLTFCPVPKLLSWRDKQFEDIQNQRTVLETKERIKTGKMAHVLSKTMTLLGIAFIIHFIIISTFADKGSLGDFSSLSMSSSSSGRHGGFGTRRQPRSYRSEKDPSKSLVSSNIVSPVAGAAAAAQRPSDKTEALFATENSTVITAQIGSTANLPCVVKNLGNGVASWIRRHDYHLLTVGMGSYSNDNRFLVSHNRPNQNWELHIKFVKPSDEGTYECQISTHPPSSIFLRLVVVEAKAEILGEPDKHVRSGSTFELVCVLRDSTEPPVYVFWYHNDRMINYDNERGVVVSSDVEKSILTIQEAQKSDSGNYTCQPSNASPSSIVVHILNGALPAAMQHGSRSAGVKFQSSPASLFFVISCLSFLVTTWLGCSSLRPYLEPHQYHPRHHDKRRRETQQKEKSPSPKISYFGTIEKPEGSWESLKMERDPPRSSPTSIKELSETSQRSKNSCHKTSRHKNRENPQCGPWEEEERRRGPSCWGGKEGERKFLPPTPIRFIPPSFLETKVTFLGCCVGSSHEDDDVLLLLHSRCFLLFLASSLLFLLLLLGPHLGWDCSKASNSYHNFTSVVSLVLTR